MIEERLKDPKLAKIRTITLFLSLNKEKELQKKKIVEAANFANTLADMYKIKGYEVQSLRIVTNPFSEYLDTSSTENILRDMQYIQDVLNSHSMPKIRIRFAIGEAQNEHEIQLVPTLIEHFGDIANICVNVEVDALGIANNKKILSCVKAMKKISQVTPRGEGNFNFTVNFNCAPLIPYFPASYFKSNLQECFALGFETPDLLVAALTSANLEQYHDVNKRYEVAYKIMSEALMYHINFCANIAKDFSQKNDFHFAGVDSSAAPSKNCSSMIDVYKLLGVSYFGASGSVEASSVLTKVFKSITDVPLVGFSGLMLAVVEDLGLAQGTIEKNYDIRNLLLYSAICGIGLDTVPIADNVEDAKIASLMRDTATMAFRLNKPLTVRLFPIPGKKVGESTEFQSDDLCNALALEVH
jgi:uncharacterized protein (UPF0210 family)